MPYDLLISDSRRDNEQGRVTALKEHVDADYRVFANNDLRFFDLEDIRGGDDRPDRILVGLRESKVSPQVR